MKVLRNSILMIFIIFFAAGIMNCVLEPEDPSPEPEDAAQFFGVWRSKKPDNTDHWRLTMNEDMTYAIEQYEVDDFYPMADGRWDYDDETSEMTIFFDNIASGDGYGPPAEYQPEKEVKYVSIDGDRMLIDCYLGGDLETGRGNWLLVSKRTVVGIGDVESTAVLNLTGEGTLHYSVASDAGGPNESCDANYTFEGDQIIISDSTDENVLENRGYTYEITGQGFYFSKLGDYSVYPFQRAE